MKLRLKGMMALATLVFVGLMGISVVDRAKAQTQAKAAPAAAAKGPTAGEFYKNVTTSTLKGLTPSDFLGAMGVISAALGYDCADCHPGAGADHADFVTDANPVKKRARRMIDMVAVINKDNFGGAQMVTCYTCHHALDLPVTTIALDKLYGPPSDDKRDVVVPAEGQPSSDKILDQYIEALGGAQRLATLKSYVVTGKSEGYAGLGAGGLFQIFAQLPDRRGMWINYPETPDRGISAWTFDGKTGWVNVPRGLFPQYELSGNDLRGAKLDATVDFPGSIKGTFDTWRVGQDDTIGDREVYVVQGGNAATVLGTFYFDKKTHLLMRYVRYTPSPVGRISIQQDFDDYRDVNGIKFPFKYSFLWLDGRFTALISDVKVNVPIDPKKFGKP
jgi:Photosynthetic reaction centre cytochrome C subunit